MHHPVAISMLAAEYFESFRHSASKRGRRGPRRRDEAD